MLFLPFTFSTPDSNLLPMGFILCIKQYWRLTKFSNKQMKVWEDQKPDSACALADLPLLLDKYHNILQGMPYVNQHHKLLSFYTSKAYILSSYIYIFLLKFYKTCTLLGKKFVIVLNICL